MRVPWWCEATNEICSIFVSRVNPRSSSALLLASLFLFSSSSCLSLVLKKRELLHHLLLAPSALRNAISKRPLQTPSANAIRLSKRPSNALGIRHLPGANHWALVLSKRRLTPSANFIRNYCSKPLDNSSTISNAIRNAISNARGSGIRRGHTGRKQRSMQRS